MSQRTSSIAHGVSRKLEVIMRKALLAFGLLSLHLLSVLADRQRDPYQVRT